MITIRRSHERGHARHGWLESFHTFSFADYWDPKHMGFRALRVINEDRVSPGRGFGAHGHRDMEIVSYVLAGSMAHDDTVGGAGELRPGEVQRMSAGTGVMHSEFNPSKTEPLHFLQIWIMPAQRGLRPSYEQRDFGDERKNRLRLIVDRDGREGALRIHQDASIYAAVLEPSVPVAHALRECRHAWVQLARGAATIGGELLEAGDGAAISGARDLDIVATHQGAELLLFELA